ncbi:MAG: YkgJ family cysteine cluster protein, partial [Deltaproteobacteria bacterium]|nr:YkgJ family cysteine cluster protein [Deltaproteobacteria bacterium]
MKSMVRNKTPWYVAGLYFECKECGACCSGPGEGYIWVAKPEIEFIADYLKMTVGQLRQKYTRRVGLRTTIL